MVLGLLGLSMIPAVLYSTTGQRFDVVTQLFSRIGGFALFTGAALAVAGIAGHLRNKAYELVVTKPCTPETWLASQFAAAMVVVTTMLAIGLGICLVLFAVLDVPVQSGIFYLAAHRLAQALVLYSYVVLLCVLFHPVLAALLVLMLRAEIVRWLLVWLETGTNLAQFPASRWLLGGLRWLLTGLYSILPIWEPHSATADRVARTLRVEAGDLRDLGGAAGYALCFALLAFLLAAAVLRSRRLGATAK